MIDLECSADCPCCGSDKTVRKEIDVYERSYNTIVVLIHNKCQACKAEFAEKIATDILTYDIVQAEEMGEYK